MTSRPGGTAPAAPPAGAYRPWLALESPGGKPSEQPRFRVLLKRRDWEAWQKLINEAGVQNAQQLWDHLAHRADLPPFLGKCEKLKGKHVGETPDKWSAIYHYSVSGPGRANYRFHNAFTGGSTGKAHKVVRIVSIELGSH